MSNVLSTTASYLALLHNAMLLWQRERENIYRRHLASEKRKEEIEVKGLREKI